MDKVCLEAKENIHKALEKLNREPVTNESAELYHWLTKSLYNLVTIDAMTKYDGESYGRRDYPMGMSGDRISIPYMDYERSRDGRAGRDGDSDGMYRESGRMMPRYYYSGHMGKEHMMMDLKAMLADADTDKERRRINDLIEDLKEMK